MTTFKYLYVQDAFKDVLNLIMKSFEPVQTNEIEFKNKTILCRLVRVRDDRMTFNVYSIDADNGIDDIIHCTFFYNSYYTSTDFDNFYSNFRLYPNGDDIVFSTYRKDSTELLISHTKAGIFEKADKCTLQYPLQEEQVFQELTRFPVPLESDIDLFMNIGSYVMDGITKFKAYTFVLGWIAEYKIDETNKENMVQSVHEVLDGLIQIEKDRIEARDEECRTC